MIPPFSPDADWQSLGLQYRTGPFLGTMFELTAQGYVLALMSRYFALGKQRSASATEKVALSVACIIGVSQMCIHFQMMYHNGISNYLQVTRLALDDDWQIKSIWALGSAVWATGCGVLIWDLRKKTVGSAQRDMSSVFLLVLIGATAASGLAVTIMRAIFPSNATATLSGTVTMPTGFKSVKPILYLHYGLIVFSQIVLSVVAFPNARHNRIISLDSRWQTTTAILHYYKQLMVVPLIVAIAVLLCFAIAPGKNLELAVYLPFSAISLANVISILNQHIINVHGTDSSCTSSSHSDSMQKNQHYHSASKSLVFIPVERTEVVDVSDKDASYAPARVGLNRLPYSSSKSTVSSGAYEENEKVSLNRVRTGSFF